MTEKKEKDTGAVSVKELLEAMHRRGVTNEPTDPAIGQFESLRTASAWTGVLYEPQVTTLKRGAMLIGGGPVTLAINTEEKKISISFGPGSKSPFAHPNKHLLELVEATLGSGWCVTIEGTCDSRPDKKSGKSLPPGKRGPKKGTRSRG